MSAFSLGNREFKGEAPRGFEPRNDGFAVPESVDGKLPDLASSVTSVCYQPAAFDGRSTVEKTCGARRNLS